MGAREKGFALAAAGLIATVGLGAPGGAASLAAAAGAPLPNAQRTHPRVRPRSGGPQTTFVVAFTPRQTPGHQGILMTDYRVQVSGRARPSSACVPPQPPPLESGAAGVRTRVTLLAPSQGWCAGRYRATVFLQRGPYCPPSATGEPVPCPEFATQDLATGSAVFTVRRAL